MASMKLPRYESLSFDSIERSKEISNWASQFSEKDRFTAKAMLSHLKFVTRDEYSRWLSATLQQTCSVGKWALYAVRKLENTDFWGAGGTVALRPGESLGSEDLVYSLIANYSRANANRFFDHPSIEKLRDNKIHDIALIDDSIGSGERVSSFIRSFLAHPTALSWWNLGLLRFHILSFSRTRDAEKRILSRLKGSDHHSRRYPKHTKIAFGSSQVFDVHWLAGRWGKNYLDMIDLCDNENRIYSFYQRGFGQVMSNLVFFHSVPDNIPGIFWSSENQWIPIFPGRSMPEWIIQLLNSSGSAAHVTPQAKTPQSQMQAILGLIRAGLHNPQSVAVRLGCDVGLATLNLDRVRQAGLISSKYRLTKAGLDFLRAAEPQMPLAQYDYSLYIPDAWCAGQAPAQPSNRRR
jgi:hypothetical protein